MYYLRDRKGKSARISEKIKKSIGVDISEKTDEIETIKETTAIENKPKAELKKEDLKKENTLKGKDAFPKSKLKKEELKAEKK